MQLGETQFQLLIRDTMGTAGQGGVQGERQGGRALSRKQVLLEYCRNKVNQPSQDSQLEGLFEIGRAHV